jgi:hypothetical protein
MVNLETIQEDIASLPLDAQQIILELINILKKRYSVNREEMKEPAIQDWSDFIGCMEAEPDFSQNYKIYLSSELNQKYDHC